MQTQKWHALDHVCSAIRGKGDMAYLHAGLFESFHKHSKRSYVLSSQRSRNVLNKVLEKET